MFPLCGRDSILNIYALVMDERRPRAWSWLCGAGGSVADRWYGLHTLMCCATALAVLQGVYYSVSVVHSLGVLPRAARSRATRVLDILFGVSFAAAIQARDYCAGKGEWDGVLCPDMDPRNERIEQLDSSVRFADIVTLYDIQCTHVQTSFITYTVLVPSALLLRDSMPAYEHGPIEILLSPQGHIMHSLNTGRALSRAAPAPSTVDSALHSCPAPAPVPDLRESWPGSQAQHARSPHDAQTRTRTNTAQRTGVLLLHVFASVPVQYSSSPICCSRAARCSRATGLSGHSGTSRTWFSSGPSIHAPACSTIRSWTTRLGRPSWLMRRWYCSCSPIGTSVASCPQGWPVFIATRRITRKGWQGSVTLGSHDRDRRSELSI
jgi:hypothetical protein